MAGRRAVVGRRAAAGLRARIFAGCPLVGWPAGVLTLTALAVVNASARDAGDAVAVLPATQEAHSNVFLDDLRCEHLTDPLGIDARLPRFSWKLRDKAFVRRQKQTAYHVLVASDPALLDDDRGNLWDSGRVAASQSTLVPYGGPSLVSNQACYWKVRVFDLKGRPSPWSAVARFSMGLLGPDDWTAAWIRHPTAPPERHLWYRKSIALEQPLSSAFMHVASVGYHELYINGDKADDRVLAPALTRLDKRVLYVTYDVARFLKPGKNTVAVWTGPGWARYSFFETRPALRVQLNATTFDGRQVSLASDESWKTEASSSWNTGSARYKDNGGEAIDARLYIEDWNSIAFDDAQWANAATTAVRATLSAHMIQPSRAVQKVKVQTIDEQLLKGKTQCRVVFEKNFTGMVRVEFRGLKAGDEVAITVADDSATQQDFGQRSLYIAKGRDGEQFQHRFNYACGRYVTICGLADGAQVAGIAAFAIATDLQRTGRFSCSSELFDKIYETDLWTFRCNTTEGFTSDCPHRERLGYGEASFATAWGIGIPCHDSSAYYLKLVRDWSDVQEESGWIHHTAPQINKHYGGPMWSSAGLSISWESYLSQGDVRVLEATYPASRRWIAFLRGRVAGGLLRSYSDHWGKFLGDWAAPGQRRERGDSREAEYFNNCVYAMNLATVVNIANVLGKADDAAIYSRQLDALRQRVHQEYYDPSSHTYCGGNQVRHSFALLAGIVPAELVQLTEAGLERNIAELRYFDMGSSGLPVLLKYLVEQSPRPEAAFEALSQTTEPSYGYFLSRGETTWPEYWNVEVPSRVHTCYTGVSALLTKGLAGIRPDPNYPGYRSFLIKPVFAAGIAYAEASVESPYGRIESRWERSDSEVTLALTIPPNSTATAYLPTSDPARVMEGGRALAETTGVDFLTAGSGYVLVRVDSGKYEFSVRQE